MTTSYPRYEGDPAGNFVGEAVSRLREAGVEMEVVSPASFKHYGIAYGSGVVGNLKREPWRTAMLPAMLRNFRAAARRAAEDADLVHAHWLPTGLVAAHIGKPFVVQLWGTDVELARRARPLARHVLRRARLVICPSRALAESARELGAGEVRVIPSGVEVPPHVREEADPPEVLFAGRLSPEKGILELVAATEGMNLVVAGDGPLRTLVPRALGFVPHEELERLYDRAAVVVLPSYREGLPLCVLEAMAHGRPVVATRVGGIPELVEDGVTGFLVEPGDVAGLRVALERLLADPMLRRRMGREARRR